MSKYQVVLIDGQCNRGVYEGNVLAGAVKTSKVVWDVPEDRIEQTHSYHLNVEGQVPLVLTGDAYRNLDQYGYVEKLELLAVLDMPAAVEVAKFAEKGDHLFHALVTTDATQSCSIYSDSDDEEGILDEAKSSGCWELNDGNCIGEVYFGGGAQDDIDQICITEFIDILLREARAKVKADVEAKAYDLAMQIARMQKWGETIDGQPFEPADGVEDLHRSLTQLIDQARSLTALVA